MAFNKTLTLIFLSLCMTGLVGCGALQVNLNGSSVDLSQPAKAAEKVKDQAALTACTAIRQQLDKQYQIALGNAGTASASFSAIVKNTGLACPSGGTYTYDKATSKTSCSVHGE